MSMKKYSALEKYNIISEGRSKNKQVAKVCEKYGISRETFYQWEARIKEAALEALEDKAPGPKVALLNQDEADLESRLEALEIENACLKLKHEWNEFQIELHGTEEQKRIIKEAKKKDFSQKKSSGSLKKE